MLTRHLAVAAVACFLAVPVKAAADIPLLERTISTVQWRADLAFFRRYVEVRHPDPFLYVSRGEFENALASFNRELPTLNNAHIVLGFQRLLAMIHDGHTGLPYFRPYSASLTASLGYHRYPILNRTSQ